MEQNDLLFQLLAAKADSDKPIICYVRGVKIINGKYYPIIYSKGTFNVSHFDIANVKKVKGSIVFFDHVGQSLEMHNWNFAFSDDTDTLYTCMEQVLFHSYSNQIGSIKTALPENINGYNTVLDALGFSPVFKSHYRDYRAFTADPKKFIQLSTATILDNIKIDGVEYQFQQITAQKHITGIRVKQGRHLVGEIRVNHRYSGGQILPVFILEKYNIKELVFYLTIYAVIAAINNDCGAINFSYSGQSNEAVKFFVETLEGLQGSIKHDYKKVSVNLNLEQVAQWHQENGSQEVTT